MTENDARNTRGDANAQGRHSVQMEKRALTTLTGILDVIRFTDTEVVLKTDLGTLSITGQGMQILKLSLDEQQLRMSGLVSALSYADSADKASGRPLWRRAFR